MENVCRQVTNLTGPGQSAGTVMDWSDTTLSTHNPNRRLWTPESDLMFDADVYDVTDVNYEYVT